MSLSTEPLWVSGILFASLTLASAILGPLVVRRRVALDRLRTNNEVAGFKFATVGVIYAVLLGFAVIVVWEKFSDSEMAVVQEAGAAATIYRLADGLDKPGAALRKQLTTYLDDAIDKDWPAMERGKSSAVVTQALDAVYATLLTARPSGALGTAVIAEVFRQLDLITQARRTRLVAAAGIVPGVMWLVLFGGACRTIGFTFFFGTFNLRAQMMMTGLLSALISLGLLIIIAIDHPFAGSVKVGPHALALVLEDFGAAPGR
ncbi:MAG: DUF4239 domain-containing protein [Pseudomonadota bacterium]|nr:DUF4239 domain-containing protein [Pseudomonadota bacterium]